MRRRGKITTRRTGRNGAQQASNDMSFENLFGFKTEVIKGRGERGEGGLGAEGREGRGKQG
eukprot:762696-Hanusia_phi.AAC.1